MTDSTFTFVDKNGLFKMTVKLIFLEKCPNPSEYDMDTLAEQFKFYEFLHSPFGSGIEVLVKGKEKEIFFIDGKHIRDEEVIKTIKSKKQFNASFDEAIKS